jgi:hypothetical protein
MATIIFIGRVLGEREAVSGFKFQSFKTNPVRRRVLKLETLKLETVSV